MPLRSAGNPIGKPFVELQSVDSTNKYAMGLIHNDHLTEGQDEAQHGMVIFSHEQTDGKGQRGRTWTSEKGANIALSILLNPFQLRVTAQFKAVSRGFVVSVRVRESGLMPTPRISTE